MFSPFPFPLRALGYFTIALVLAFCIIIGCLAAPFIPPDDHKTQ